MHSKRTNCNYVQCVAQTRTVYDKKRLDDIELLNREQHPRAGSSAARESSFSVGECSHGRCSCDEFPFLSFLFLSCCTSRTTAGCCARFAYERFRHAVTRCATSRSRDDRSDERDFILSHIPIVSGSLNSLRK